MKITAVRLIALLGMMLLPHASNAQASSLSDLLGLKPVNDRTHTSEITNSDRSQYQQAPRSQGPAYPNPVAKRINSTDTLRSVVPGPIYKQSTAPNQSNPRQITSSKPHSKGKTDNRSANKTLPSVTTIRPNEQANSRLAYSYQPVYPSQPNYAAPQGYRQPPGTSYYYPYQRQYSPVPNYYQGYSYGAWGGGSAAQRCAPGRA